jgi:hypothetical protein
VYKYLLSMFYSTFCLHMFLECIVPLPITSLNHQFCDLLQAYFILFVESSECDTIQVQYTNRVR